MEFYQFLRPFSAPLNLPGRFIWWKLQHSIDSVVSCGECPDLGSTISPLLTTIQPPPHHLDWSDHSLAGWLFSLIYCSLDQKHLGVTSVGPGAALCIIRKLWIVNISYQSSPQLSCSPAPLRIACFVVVNGMKYFSNKTKHPAGQARPGYDVQNQQTIHRQSRTLPRDMYVVWCKYLNKRKIIKTNILKFRIFRCDPKYLHTMYIITSYMDLRN